MKSKSKTAFLKKAGPFLAVAIFAMGVVLFLTRPEEISGRVSHVPDGKTLVVAGEPGETTVELFGIAVPGANSAKGQSTAVFLSDLALNREVTCAPSGDRNGITIVAVCTINGEDLAAALVRAGLALDCPQYSGGRYAAAERAAVADGANLRASFVLPSRCEGEKTARDK